MDHQGTTGREQHEGESLDQRLAEERTDPALEEPGADDLVGDLPGGQEDPLDAKAGADRTGLLAAEDEGAREDAEKDMIADDIGIDGGAASAEEAAVHRVPDEDDTLP